MPAPADALPPTAEQLSHTQRRATPELIEFYRKRAHELRAEAVRNGISDAWALLIKMIRSRSRLWGRLRHATSNGSPFWGTR